MGGVKEYVGRCEKDVDFFLRNEFRIQASAASGLQSEKLVKLAPNQPQKRLRATIARMLAAGGPVWIQMLKSRQWGGSTETSGESLHELLFKPRTRALVVSHTVDSTEHIFGMYETAAFNLDLLKGRSSVPKKGRGLRLWFANGSLLRGQTAGRGKGQHSFTYDYAHYSERSRWLAPEETMKGVGPATKDARFKMDESTANGRTGAFYESWLMGQTLEEWLACKPAQRRHVNVFVPWFEVEWYRRAVDEADLTRWSQDRKSFVRAAELTDDDLEYGARCALDLGQLLWRRAIIESDTCRGSVDIFDEQYPCTPESAFLSSGSPAIPRSLILKREEQVVIPVWQGAITDSGELSESGGGPLWIWKQPVAGHRYVLAGDPGFNEIGRSYGALQVIDIDAREQVAEQMVKSTPGVLARQTAVLGRHYNMALVAPEAKGHGIGYVEALSDYLKYPNIYYYMKPWTAGVQTAIRPGVPMSPECKEAMSQTAFRLFADLTFKIYSSRLLQQAATLELVRIGEGSGKGGSEHTGPPKGGSDDVWMAFIIASYVCYDRWRSAVPLLAPPEPEVKRIPGYNASLRFDRDYGERAYDMPVG